MTNKTARTMTGITGDLGPVPVHDGVRLFANLYTPTADGTHPVIMTVTPYGRDNLSDGVALSSCALLAPPPKLGRRHERGARVFYCPDSLSRC
jgi:predicted acyl esterase